MNKVPKSTKPKDDVKVKLLSEQVTDLTQALQRERADNLNIQRRHEEQIAGLRQMMRGDIAKVLLPVIDNFERSLKHLPKDLEGNDYIAGIQGIVKQFEKTLESLGVEKIQTIGEVFDPSLHEAVSMEDGKGAHEIVCEELQPGYKIGDQVIRHAMVKVKMSD